MGRPGGRYPQVEPGVEALLHRQVITVSPRLTVARAAGRARRAGARVVAAPAAMAVRSRDLFRLTAWRLGGLRVRDVAQRPVPMLPASATEAEARRRLHEGAPMLLVREGARITGAVEVEQVPLPGPRLSVARRIEEADGPAGEAWRWLLHRAGKLGDATGVPVFGVGGLVRDLLLGRPAFDVDLVVEGDGIAFAQRLAEETGGRVVGHGAFKTASVEGARAPDGTALGRLDVATARRERYPRPGALPHVEPAGLAEDLRRRDFTVNAMLLTLAPSDFGWVVDPLGGRRDLERRRLRPLHPLSFVEDPTRVLRAARYAARLGFRLDLEGERALGLCLRSGPYPALSGSRLRAELALIAAEVDPVRPLTLLIAWRAAGLLAPGYRAGMPVRARLAAASRLLGAAGRAGIALEAPGVWLLALLLGQPRRVAMAALDRLAVSGRLRAELEAAYARGAATARALEGRRTPSRRATTLRSAGTMTAAAAWLAGRPTARRAIRWYWEMARHLRPEVTGADLLAMGVAPGPDLGRLLDRLRDGRLDGRLRTREDEVCAVAAWRVTKQKGESR